MLSEELRNQLIAIKKKVDKNPRYQPTAEETAMLRQAAVARQAEGRIGVVALGERVLAGHKVLR